MTEQDLARRLLAQLRQVPNPTPAKFLALFKYLLADAKANGWRR